MVTRYDLIKTPDIVGFQLVKDGLLDIEVYGHFIDEHYLLSIRTGMGFAPPFVFGIAHNPKEAERRLYERITEWIKGHAIDKVEDKTGLAAKVV